MGEADHPLITPQSSEVRRELEKLGTLVLESDKFELKERGFYELKDEEAKDNMVQTLLELKQISPIRTRIFRASGPGHPQLYSSTGRLDIYVLRLHGQMIPTVGGRGDNDQKVQLNVGDMVTITGQCYVSPGLDFLTLSGGNLGPTGKTDTYG
ncbi:hypothetical protein BBP40_003098 [Aspergillus hancockii]|nr:hypothetical protein BBP40_003098 [Aspergillus hancockii]